MGFKTFFSKAGFPPPPEAGSEVAVRGGTDMGEKETGGRLPAGVTFSSVRGAPGPGAKVGDITEIATGKTVRKGF